MHKNVLAWTVQTLVVWCLNTMISICQRGQSSYCEMTHEFTTAWREPAVSLFICAWKRQISMLALTDCNKFEQQTCMLPLCISWILCFSTAFLHVCTPQVRINIYSSSGVKKENQQRENCDDCLWQGP